MQRKRSDLASAISHRRWLRNAEWILIFNRDFHHRGPLLGLPHLLRVEFELLVDLAHST